MAAPAIEAITSSPHTDPSYTLVLGIDGSGKSTFLSGLQNQYGTEFIEVTASPESRAFKAAHVDTPIDIGFIAARRALYLDLCRQFETQAQSSLAAGNSVSTTGFGLITDLSHNLMSEIVAPGSACNYVEDAVKAWFEGNEVKPDNIVLVHAPFEVILQRILARQEAGDASERFWGFNSPHFLRHYQEAWRDAVDLIGRWTSIKCLTLDTSQLNPDEMLEIAGQELKLPPRTQSSPTVSPRPPVQKAVS